jgi:hypothetical protein
MNFLSGGQKISEFLDFQGRHFPSAAIADRNFAAITYHENGKLQTGLTEF